MTKEGNSPGVSREIEKNDDERKGEE